jgi:hypothetical protein
MHSLVAGNPLLHGPLHACCVGSQHDGGCCGVPPLVSQHSPWMGTCLSPWLVPPDHCQVPCTHLLLGIHSYMAPCLPALLAVSMMVVVVVSHPLYLNIHLPHPSPWTSTCLSPWLAPSLHCQVPCTLLWLWVHSYMATPPPHSVPLVGCCCGVPPLVPQHSPWRGTCFSPWLVLLNHCQVPCTHLWLGIHSYMAPCMPAVLAVSMMVAVVVSHP